MTDFHIPTPKQLAQLRRSTHLSVEDFGKLLNYQDPARVVRALEKGERHGKPYRLSGTGMAALTYAQALAKILSHKNPAELLAALNEAKVLIPERMRT
jgi:hypothetical protein